MTRSVAQISLFMSGEKKGSSILARCGVYPEGIRALSPGLPRAPAGRAGLPWVNAALRIIYPERVLAPPVRGFAPTLCRVDIDLGTRTQGSSRTRNPGLSAPYPFRDRHGPANRSFRRPESAYPRNTRDLLVRKDVLLPITAVHYVIESAPILNAELPSHGRHG